ncbi:MAG: MlaD family protein, partial [Myxococcota bacterium]
MSDSPNKQSVIVGLFVAVAIVFFGGAILTIGSLNDTFSRKVRVTTAFDEVNGLQTGNNVWFSGVKVGTVKRVDLEGARVTVELAIDREATPFIHADAKAKVSSDGLIGNKIVVVYEGTADAPAIRDGDALEAGVAVSTEQMMAMFQENNQNLLAITTDVKGLTARLAAGEGTAGKLLTDDTLYADLTTAVSSLKTASDNAVGMTSSLSSLAADLNREGNLAKDLASDQQTYASLTASVHQLQSVADDAATVVDGLAAGAANPETPIGTLFLDQEAGSDLKQVLENLNTGSVLLSDNLEAMQHNVLLRGFFKKKARAEAEAGEPAPGEADDG